MPAMPRTPIGKTVEVREYLRRRSPLKQNREPIMIGVYDKAIRKVRESPVSSDMISDMIRRTHDPSGFDLRKK